METQNLNQESGADVIMLLDECLLQDEFIGLSIWNSRRRPGFKIITRNFEEDIVRSWNLPVY